MATRPARPSHRSTSSTSGTGSMRAGGTTNHRRRSSRPSWSSGPNTPTGRPTNGSPASGSTGTVSAWECRTGDEVPVPGHRVVEAGAPRSPGQGHRRIASRDGLGERLERAGGKARGAGGGRGDGSGRILPGGFSYGDYLRTGALARFAPIMDDVRTFAGRGGPVVGICNGFQILCEAGLLSGALIRNRQLRFVCRFVDVRVETSLSTLTE